MTEILRCDFCGEEMDRNETGMFILALEKGGHISCARKVVA